MVPSNFVEIIVEDNGDKVGGKDVEVFAASEEEVHKASQIIKVRISSPYILSKTSISIFKL